jgi:hypothetical protein
MQKGFAPIVTFLVTLVVLGAAGGGYYLYRQNEVKKINSFEECTKHYPVLESYPA